MEIYLCWELCAAKFLNPMSNNSEIIIIWQLRRVVPRLEVLLFTRKENIINETGRFWGHVQKGLQEYLYINCFGMSWPLVSYSINFISYEDSRKHGRDHEDPESADGDIQMEYSFD
jgi:hypothetical protein